MHAGARRTGGQGHIRLARRRVVKGQSAMKCMSGRDPAEVLPATGVRRTWVNTSTFTRRAIASGRHQRLRPSAPRPCGSPEGREVAAEGHVLPSVLSVL